MRAVVHWFRSVAILGGLCALPCGQAAPSSMIERGSAHRPALVSVGGAGATVLATTVPRNANFVEASTPITLGSLRHGARDVPVAPAVAARKEAMAVGFGAGQLRKDELPAGGHPAPDANTMLALVLAALGVAALAAARAPATQAASLEELPGEPVRR